MYYFSSKIPARQATYKAAEKSSMRPTSPYLWLGLLWLAALIGVGAFTFHYGEGLSYFSTNPDACANCHIMRPQLDSYRKSSHHAAATCVDCHLPRSFLSKYLAKAENGWNHSTAFTLQNFPEPILINKKNSRILQQNCLACHSAFVHQIVATEAVRCVHCHRTVGHGEWVGLGGAETTHNDE